MDEEHVLEAELNAWDDKFESYMLEKSEPVIQQPKRIGQRASSVSSRLHKA